MSLRPPPKKQGNSAKGWASCMESWTYISWYWPSALDTKIPKFDNFLLDFNLGNSIGNFSAKKADALMEDYGYFMIIARTSPTFSHAWLVCSVVDGKLKAMEPAENRPENIEIDPAKLPKIMVFSPAIVN